MPRAKKTQGNYEPQPVERVPNQTYGDAKQQIALQQQMPTPNLAIPPRPTTTVASAPTQQETPQELTQPTNITDVVSRLSGNTGILYAPDDQPQTPVTDGLRFGPGRGPEVMNVQSSMARTLQQLANNTRDPFFLELLAKVNR